MKVEISLVEENYDLIEEANYGKQLWADNDSTVKVKLFIFNFL
jgi:hypothetical protein